MFDRVLGVDPGVSRCGYGLVVRDGGKLRAASCGVIRTPVDAPLEERLTLLADELDGLVAELRPTAVAVERVYFQSNTRTAMSVGQASGLALLSATRAGVAVGHYTPSEVKLAVTGSGRADKAQVQAMVQVLLGLAAPPRPPDVADALALAICHLSAAPLRSRLADAIARVDGPGKVHA